MRSLPSFFIDYLKEGPIFRPPSFYHLVDCGNKKKVLIKEKSEKLPFVALVKYKISNELKEKEQKEKIYLGSTR
jgi:hypothetical protein|tara:strand:- start:300 stop:521 length:222 start_codon:yes stop_codon:yes gene_type:complete